MDTNLKKTALFHQHQALNAKLVPFANFEMPIQYSSILQEVKAVRSNVGIFDVSHMGEFIVEGKEAAHFVDFATTNQFMKAPVGKAVYSPLCRDNGTIVDDLISYKLSENKTLICVNASNIEKDWNHLNNILQNHHFDCKLTDMSNQFSLIAIQGPNAEKILKLSLPEYSLLKKNLNYYEVQEITPFLIIARTGYTGEDGFEVFCSNQQAPIIWEQLMKNNSVPCGLGSRDVLRTEVAYPLYGHELSDELTPLDCQLKWTVDFNKEIFMGKNFLVNYKPKYKLIKLSIPKQIPRAEQNIHLENGTKVGVVTSGTFSPTLEKGIAIGLIDSNYNPSSCQFMINIREKLVPAEYHSKPFFTGGHK